MRKEQGAPTTNANNSSREPQEGKGLIRVNGKPLHLVQPEILRFKVRFIPWHFENTTQHPTLGDEAPARVFPADNL